MTRRMVWRFATTVMAFAILLVFAAVLTYGGPFTAAQGLLVLAGAVFAYVTVRLSHTLVSADAEHRRRAARRLVVLALVPALVLTPTVMDRTPAEFHTDIVIAGVVWAMLAMAYTSFLTHRAMAAQRNAAASPPTAPSGEARVRHA